MAPNLISAFFLFCVWMEMAFESLSVYSNEKLNELCEGKMIVVLRFHVYGTFLWSFIWLSYPTDGYLSEQSSKVQHKFEMAQSPLANFI